MRRAYRRAWLSATIVCTLLVPAVGSIAADQEDLQEAQEELEAIRDRIAADEEEAASLRDRIKVVNQQITSLQIAINKLNDDIHEVQAEAAEARARIDHTQAQIDRIQTRAIEQAVAAYKGGTAQTLDALLSSTTLGELNDRIQMLGIAAEENTGALVKYGRLKLMIQEQHEDLFAIQKELNETLASREEFQKELEGREAVLAADLEKLNLDLDREHALEDKKQEEYEDIRAEILAAQAASPGYAPVGPPPDTGAPSASGFIWPLNGGVTSGFGPRWGRMHNGIDIDGYSGQPIVASKAGRVISAGDGGDGYGTKVVLDHGGGFATLYAHMSRLGVSSGASVSQGQVVGYVGCTGSCTGDHLHFEIRVNGSPQNPLAYLP